MPMTKDDHFDPSRTPKRILALDGGGLRGVLTLEYLSVIEDTVRRRNGSNVRLCDYFDLIGGTSTGAIIAASLACGMSVAELKKLYRELGKSVFRKKLIGGWGLLSAKFPSSRVQEALDKKLGANVTLGSDRIQTGLMIMTKRLDTGSPWPLHNHPKGRYYKQDSKLLLTQIVRASTAAPTYFDPEDIRIESRDGRAVQGAFVDGGVSPYNDPALQLLLLAAVQGHGFGWRLGRDKLLLISVGTGTYKEVRSAEAILKMPAAEQGLRALQSLMDDCARMNHASLQWLTHCLTPWRIDRAFGDMQSDSASGPQLATYARYNVLLEQEWLKTAVKVECGPEKVAKLAEMDNPDGMEELAEIGAKAARIQVEERHFEGFDISV